MDRGAKPWARLQCRKCSIRAMLDRLINERIEACCREAGDEARRAEGGEDALDDDHRHQGTLDWAYPPFILASTAAALGWDVSVFLLSTGWNC